MTAVAGAVGVAAGERRLDPVETGRGPRAATPDASGDGVAALGRTRRRPSSALRLAAFHALVLAVVLGVVVLLLDRQVSTSYQTMAANDLAVDQRAYQGAVSGATTQSALLSSSVRFLQTRSLPAGTDVVVLLPGPQLLETPGARRLTSSAVVASLLRHPPAATQARIERIGQRDVEVLAAPIRWGGRTAGVWLAAEDLSAMAGQRGRVIALSVAEATVALLAGVASAYLLLRTLLRRVGRVTVAAEEIGRGDLGRRLGDQGTDDEVGQLAATFDGMLDRIDTAMTGQRRLLSDVSHQLRTPLTVARGHLEVLQRTAGPGRDPESDATIALVIDELDHMRGLTERLLFLGRAMEPDFLAPEPVDVRALLADLFDAVRVLADRHWVLGPVADAVVSADPSKLRGALLNLVDNSVHATGPGDAIELSATDDGDGWLALAVEDAGPGIPLAQRSAVLSRFARPGSRTEGGSGLGLAIVKAVAEAHGGYVDIGVSKLGGTRVAMVVPGGAVVADGED